MCVCALFFSCLRCSALTFHVSLHWISYASSFIFSGREVVHWRIRRGGSSANQQFFLRGWVMTTWFRMSDWHSNVGHTVGRPGQKWVTGTHEFMVSGNHFVWNLLWETTWCQEFTVERQGKIWVRDRWKVAKIYVNSWFLPLGFDMKYFITVFAGLSRMADQLTTTFRLMLRAKSRHSLDCVIVIVWRIVCTSWSHQLVLGFRCVLMEELEFGKGHHKRVWVNMQEILLSSVCGVILVVFVWKGVCQAARFFTCSI